MSQEIIGAISMLSDRILQTKMEPLRGLSMECVANARQLGGIQMKDGSRVKMDRLLRTGSLQDASGNDIQRLSEVYRVKCIFDLRSIAEQNEFQDPMIPDCEWYSCPLSEETMDHFPADFDGTQETNFTKRLVHFMEMPVVHRYAADMYIFMVSSPYSQQKIGEAIHKIIDQNGDTVLWHCTQGKDRCGMLSAIILGILGADRETILSDFDISNQVYGQLASEIMNGLMKYDLSKEARNCIKAFLYADVRNMERALWWIDDNFGSMDNYLKDVLYISEEERNMMKKMYLE